MKHAMRGFCVALCGVLLLIPVLSFAQVSDAEQRAQLEAQLAQIEADIANKKGTLSDLQTQSTSLKRDISILDNKIATAQLQIKQSDLTLKKLAGNISTTQGQISDVDTRIEKNHQSIASLVRELQGIDQRSFAERALSGNFSDLFTETDNVNSVQSAIQERVAEMRGLRNDLSTKKQTLEGQQDETEKVKQAQVVAKNAVQRDQQSKNQVLKETQGKEQQYQQLIESQEKTAAQIRAALFGLRDTGAISFGQAYDYAQQASATTGVRAALIMAILTQESDLGQNVGSCYVTSLDTGAGVSKNSGRVFGAVMKAPRDTDPFRTITDTLGRDWSTTPVSCPQSSGYGGAMGPAQFIPSTWMLYKNRLSSITGESFPDPWSGRTAVFATALLMKDNGASSTRTSERTAALKYFAGAGWNRASNAIYGDSVMDIADSIQAQINVLEGQ